MLDEAHDANNKHLPRLTPEAYCGHTVVHWTHTIKDRMTGWLDFGFHSSFREILIHTCARHQLACPAYCLMPDHLHLILAGISVQSDQRKATKFLRRCFQSVFDAHKIKFQRQPYDHVLRDDERGKDGFGNMLHYVFENPVRAKLVNASSDWSYQGAIIPGYPDLDYLCDDYPEIFWKIVNQIRER